MDAFLGVFLPVLAASWLLCSLIVLGLQLAAISSEISLTQIGLTDLLHLVIICALGPIGLGMILAILHGR